MIIRLAQKAVGRAQARRFILYHTSLSLYDCHRIFPSKSWPRTRKRSFSLVPYGYFSTIWLRNALITNSFCTKTSGQPRRFILYHTSLSLYDCHRICHRIVRKYARPLTVSPFLIPTTLIKYSLPPEKSVDC